MCMEHVYFSNPTWEWDRIQDSFELFWTHSPLGDSKESSRGDIFTTKRGAVPPISVLPSSKLTVCDIEDGPLIVDLAINSMVIFYSYVSPHKKHGDFL